MDLHIRANTDAKFEEIKSVTVILDGSKRPVRPPKYDQKEFFSEKKRGIR